MVIYASINTMNLQEYINKLQSFLTEHPEMAESKVYYASDEEGNSFYQCLHSGFVFYIHSDNTENYELEEKYLDFNEFMEEQDFDSEEEARKEWDTHYIPIVVIN